MFENKHNPQKKTEKKTALEPLAAYAVQFHIYFDFPLLLPSVANF